MKRLFAFVRGVALAIPLLLVPACTKTPSEPAELEPEGRSSSCPEALVADTGPELAFLEVRNGKLFIPEVNDSTFYSTVRYFDFPGTTLQPIEYTGTRVEGGMEFPAPTKERRLLNVYCTNGSVAWSYVDSLSAEGLADFTTWKDPVAKTWAYQWLFEEPNDDPFDGCPIVYNSARAALNGPWMEATSTEEPRMTRVTEEGVYFENGPWEEARFFGELGWLPSVIIVELELRGNELFARRPDDNRFVQCNVDYWCTQDEELVWSLIVWETFVPAGASVAEHPGRGKCYQIDLWRDGGEREPVDCNGSCPEVLFPPNVGPMVEDLRRDGHVVSWKGCYSEAFVQDSRGIEWGDWAVATKVGDRWTLEIPEGWDLFTPACERRIWSYVPEGGVPPDGFLIWCDGGSCTWQLDPEAGINAFEPEGTIRLNIGAR